MSDKLETAIDLALAAINSIVEDGDRPPASEMAHLIHKRAEDTATKVSLDEFLCWFDEEE